MNFSGEELQMLYLYNFWKNLKKSFAKMVEYIKNWPSILAQPK